MNYLDADADFMRNSKFSDMHPDVQIAVLLRTVFQVKPCVYFFEFGEHVKIGWSRDVDRRWVELDILPEPIRLLMVVPGDFSLEHKYHQKFANYRERKEMFRHEGELRDFIAYGRECMLEAAKLV